MTFRVCILLPAHWGSAKGGAEYQAHCLADYLATQSGFAVTYLTREAPQQTASYSYEIESFAGPAALRNLRWGFFPDSVALYRKLKRINPDAIIQLVASAHTGVAALYAKRHQKIMYWYLASDQDVEKDPNLGVRGPAKLVDKLIFLYGVKHCTYILAQTAKQNDRMLQTLKREALAVVPNFHPLPIEPPVKPSKFTVVWIANFKPLKQPELFIKLAKELSKEDIEFKMIGRMGRSEWVQALHREIEELPNLCYLGELELDEVNEILARSHLFVNTSEYEGFPNTFIQSWMRKVPTLSINVDPDGVITRHGLGECAGDFAGLVKAVKTYKQDPELLRASAARSREFAEQNYSMKNAKQITHLLGLHLHNHPRGESFVA